MTKPPSGTQMRHVAFDVLTAVRSDRDNPYPKLVDRGAEPAVVMATTALLVRVVAGRSDMGAGYVLAQARSAIVWGRQNGTITTAEANVMVTVLQLANPHREDIRTIFDRAEAWADTRGLLDSLDVIAAAVDLLGLLLQWTPNPVALLDELAVGLMEPDIATDTRELKEETP